MDEIKEKSNKAVTKEEVYVWKVGGTLEEMCEMPSSAFEVRRHCPR